MAIDRPRAEATDIFMKQHPAQQERALAMHGMHYVATITSLPALLPEKVSKLGFIQLIRAQSHKCCCYKWAQGTAFQMAKMAIGLAFPKAGMVAWHSVMHGKLLIQVAATEPHRC